MLKIENLTFSYGKIQALKGVSFEVKQGEILSIVGANGAGKSTLMKCIAGLLKPQGGVISYNEEPLPNQPALLWPRESLWCRRAGGFSRI